MNTPASDFQRSLTHPTSRLSERLLTFLVWAVLLGIVHFSIYPTTNWLASLSARHYSLFLKCELSLPFIPAFIWFYLSMYGLFILPPFFLEPHDLKQLARKLILASSLSGVVFLLLPAQLGFPRILPAGEPYRSIFLTLFSLDLPFNLVPSLHVVYSTIISLAVIARAKLRSRIIFSVWPILIVISTILTHQHHLLDIASGLALALIIHLYWETK